MSETPPFQTSKSDCGRMYKWKLPIPAHLHLPLRARRTNLTRSRNSNCVRRPSVPKTRTSDTRLRAHPRPTYPTKRHPHPPYNHYYLFPPRSRCSKYFISSCALQLAPMRSEWPGKGSQSVGFSRVPRGATTRSVSVMH